jgi:hypothetical protein
LRGTFKFHVTLNMFRIRIIFTPKKKEQKNFSKTI